MAWLPLEFTEIPAPIHPTLRRASPVLVRDEDGQIWKTTRPHARGNSPGWKVIKLENVGNGSTACVPKVPEEAGVDHRLSPEAATTAESLGTANLAAHFHT